MMNDNSGVVKAALSVLLFPTLFQEAFIRFAWAAGDTTWVMMGKRLFLLLPVCAIILGCWVSVACVLTVVVRPNRRDFVMDLFITWWDLGKAVVSFWGGIFKFVFHFVLSVLGFVKMTLLGLWSLIHEVILMPFRLLGGAGRNLINSSVPWIAVGLTLFWCLIEAVIFTYVTTPLVVDTFSNITGDSLSTGFVRIPLFIFLLFVVLGSYAVLSTFVDAVHKKSIASMLGIGAIEIVVLFVEVVFLYREFVDSLVPWFAQYSENFELGVFWTLAISAFVWFGIRSLSWFLFAAHGTPTIMSIIQGKGVALADSAPRAQQNYGSVSTGFMDKIKEDAAWIQAEGDKLLASFVLPPLQVVAASINFCTLLVSGSHLFELPVTDMDAVKKSRSAPERRPAPAPPQVESFNHSHKNVGELQNV